MSPPWGEAAGGRFGGSTSTCRRSSASPLLAVYLASGARWLGAPLSTFHVTVLTLAPALPSASNVSLLAERYGADNGRIARVILTSTALAFVTFTLLAWTLGVR